MGDGKENQYFFQLTIFNEHLNNTIITAMTFKYNTYNVVFFFFFFFPVVIWCFVVGTRVFRFSTLRGNRSVRSESLPARRIQTFTTDKLPGRPVSIQY